MGQDSEEAAEFVATVRGEHVAMKQWYNNDTTSTSSTSVKAALHSKYGPYPALWKEVLNWAGWKEARKEYLKYKEGNNNNNNNSSSSIPRKRKSRWGNASNSNNNKNDDDNNKRRSRWNNNQGAASATTTTTTTPSAASSTLPGGLVLPGMSSNNLPPEKQQEMKQLQARLRVVNDKIQNVETEATRVDALPRGHRDRSPSPPPIYGPDGKRQNTRAVRWKQRYGAERQDILERLMKLHNPHMGRYGNTSNTLLMTKRTKKIPIPIDEHPNYNFIGLIIGPRGKTQKELEAKTGCKIAIRGRGSVKEGARGRRDGKVTESDNEPLHVVITGDDQRAVDAASDMVEQMLIVIDDEKNVHKQQQLRELALLNGTLKEDEYCQICAEKGHRSFECPRRFAAAASNKKQQQQLSVKCAICGDTSHPTRDCTQQRPNAAATGGGGGAMQQQQPTTNQQELDSDYVSFMAELEGKKAMVKTTTEAANGAVGAAPSSTAPGGGPPPPVNLPPPRPIANTATNAPPPPPVALPPPPPGGTGLPPPPPPPVVGGLPPPPQPQPSQLPPRPPMQQQQQQPPHQNYQQTHAQAHAYGGAYPPGAAPQQQQQQQQVPPPYQQPQQQQPQQQQQHQVRPGEETTGWDPSSFYGYGGTGGGAGGFNWWEQ